MSIRLKCLALLLTLTTVGVDRKQQRSPPCRYPCFFVSFLPSLYFQFPLSLSLRLKSTTTASKHTHSIHRVSPVEDVFSQTSDVLGIQQEDVYLRVHGYDSAFFFLQTGAWGKGGLMEKESGLASIEHSTDRNV